MSDHFEVVKLLDAGMKAQGVSFNQARLGKALTMIWPDVQRSWDFFGPKPKRGDPKATFSCHAPEPGARRPSGQRAGDHLRRLRAAGVEDVTGAARPDDAD